MKKNLPIIIVKTIKWVNVIYYIEPLSKILQLKKLFIVFLKL